MSKEVWLQSNAVLAGPSPRWEDRPKGMLLVVRVGSRTFSALAIAYSEAEFNILTDPRDQRPREFGWAMIRDLILVAEPAFSTYVELYFKGEV